MDNKIFLPLLLYRYASLLGKIEHEGNYVFLVDSSVYDVSRISRSDALWRIELYSLYRLRIPAESEPEKEHSERRDYRCRSHEKIREPVGHLAREISLGELNPYRDPCACGKLLVRSDRDRLSSFEVPVDQLAFASAASDRDLDVVLLDLLRHDDSYRRFIYRRLPVERQDVVVERIVSIYSVVIESDAVRKLVILQPVDRYVFVAYPDDLVAQLRRHVVLVLRDRDVLDLHGHRAALQDVSIVVLVGHVISKRDVSVDTVHRLRDVHPDVFGDVGRIVLLDVDLDVEGSRVEVHAVCLGFGHAESKRKAQREDHRCGR